jgi:hypothetical protein
MYSLRTCNHGDLERLRLHRTPCLHFLDAGAMLNGGEKRLSARTERLDDIQLLLLLLAPRARIIYSDMPIASYLPRHHLTLPILTRDSAGSKTA